MKDIKLRYLVTGLLALLPITIGWIIILYISDLILKFISFFYQVNNKSMMILIFVITILAIMGIGKKIINKQNSKGILFVESLLLKFPFVDTVVKIVKEFVDMLKGTGKFEDLGVARVPFAGGKTNAIITNIEVKENNQREYTVFIVTGTFPPTGLVCYYKEEDIEIQKQMKVKDVFQLQISIGIENKKGDN